MSGLSFPPAARIRTSREYDLVFKAGRSFHTANFKLVIAEGSAPWSRLGLVVSRRVGDAVRRNRIKRRLREWFRLGRHFFAAPLDIVVIAKPGAAGLEFGQISAELDQAVGRWRRV
ncbi:ribonuclease P protein component [bacterium]|nr:MAG: ribonuclease P protein component [bacterium]